MRWLNVLRDEVLKNTLNIKDLHEIELAPKGFSVRCKVSFEEILDLNSYIEVGIFLEDKLDKLSELLTRLTGLIGSRSRIEAYNFFTETLQKKWPMTEDGVPAYLEGFIVIFHNGEGRRYIVGGETND